MLQEAGWYANTAAMPALPLHHRMCHMWSRKRKMPVGISVLPIFQSCLYATTPARAAASTPILQGWEQGARRGLAAADLCRQRGDSIEAASTLRSLVCGGIHIMHAWCENTRHIAVSYQAYCSTPGTTCT